jgi:hypothetical protein
MSFRVVILVLMMLIIIPVLTVNESDSSNSIAVKILGDLAVLNYTDTSQPPLYNVRYLYNTLC